MAVLEGDEWKHRKLPVRSATRAEEQHRINTLYAIAKLTLEQWRAHTAELSDLTKWSAGGRAS